jgi:hypothetical protein
VAFWNSVQFDKKYKSFAILLGIEEILDQKYREFNYKPPVLENVSIGEKAGSDYHQMVKPRTIRDFLK